MRNERSLILLTDRLGVLIRQRLWFQVLVGMLAGIGVGVAIGPSVGWTSPETAVLIGNWLALPGRLFLLAIQFVVVPLVVASIIRGIAVPEADVSLKKLGSWTVGFFLLTTVIAVIIGITAASFIHPGAYIQGDSLDSLIAAAEAGEPVSASPMEIPGPAEIPEFITGLFPRDPLTTFVSGNMLQIVITAAILGIALVTTPAEQRKPLLDLLASVQAACMVIVGWVLRFAPIAVFGLLANIIARVGLSALIGTGMYVATVVLGLALLLFVYVAIAVFIGQRRPNAFLSAIREVFLLAFSTSSSAAVMPLSLDTAEKNFSSVPRCPASWCLWERRSIWAEPRFIRAWRRFSLRKFFKSTSGSWGFS